MDEFSFKYVPEAELSKIVKQVKRDRIRRNEEKEWEEYLERRKLKLLNKNFKQKAIFTGSLCNDNEIQQLNYRKEFPFSINEYHPGDGKPFVTNENHDFSTKEIDFDPENVKKLDKLRIFDSPCFLGSNCSSVHHASSNNFRHSRQTNFDQNVNHYCQQIEEPFNCRNHKLHQNSFLPTSSLSSKGAGDDDDLHHKNSDCQSIPLSAIRPNSVNVCESFNKRHGKSGCLNLSQSAPTKVGHFNSDKQSKVLSNDGYNELNEIDSPTLVDILAPANSFDPCYLNAASVHPSIVGDYNERLSTSAPSSARKDVLNYNQKLRQFPNGFNGSSSLLYSADNYSILETGSDILCEISNHRQQKPFKALSVIEEENLLSTTNKGSCDLEKDTDISNKPLCRVNCYLNGGFMNNDIGVLNPDPLDDSSSRNQINKHQVLLFDGELKARVDNLKVRLTAVINKILDISTRSVDFEDDEDVERKIKKTKEFVSRFSRNYLYQLRRQVEMMKKLNLNTCEPQTFYQKLFLSFQTSLQALQAFQNILPDQSTLSFNKLVEFLELFLLLLEYTENLFGDTYDNKELKIVCSTLIVSLKNNSDQRETKNMKTKNALSLKNNGESKDKLKANNKKKVAKKLISSKKLSMYASSSVGLPINWKKTSANLAKRKFGPPNKKLRDGDLKKNENCKNKFDGNVEGEMKISDDEHNKFNAVGVDSKGSGKRISNDEDALFYRNNRNLINGDDNNNMNGINNNGTLGPSCNKYESTLLLEPAVEILTAVENCIIDTDDNDNLELPKDCDERMKIFLLFDKLSEMICQSSKEKEQLQPKDIDQGKEKQVGIKSEISKEEIKKVVQQIHEMYSHPESLGLTRKSLDEKCEINGTNKKCVTAKYITNKHENVKNVAKNVSYTSVQFDEEEHKRRLRKPATGCRSDAENAKGCRIPLVELQVSDKQLESLLKYRNDFVNYTKESPFYEQFYERWSIVKRIGDHLLSKLLKDISKELEVNALIQKMYELEFNRQLLNTQ